MRLKSKGLGRKELVMDFREYEVVRDGDEIIIVGTIRDPVVWDFTIRVCEDDLAGILSLASHKRSLPFFLKSLFKRDKASHWSKDRREHVAGTAEHRATARERAEELAAAAWATERPKRSAIARRREARSNAAPDLAIAASA